MAVPDAVRHVAPSVHGTVPAAPVGTAARRPLLTCAPHAGCRFDGARLFAVEAFFGGAVALEGCSFSGLVSEDGNEAAVIVFGSSAARVQNCTFSGNDADVFVAFSVLFTDTPLGALTLAAETDGLIEPLADAPAGDFPTMARPAFVALRQVRPGRPAGSPRRAVAFARHSRRHCTTRLRVNFCVHCSACDLPAAEAGSGGRLIGRARAHAPWGMHSTLCSEGAAPVQLKVRRLVATASQQRLQRRRHDKIFSNMHLRLLLGRTKHTCPLLYRFFSSFVLTLALFQ